MGGITSDGEIVRIGFAVMSAGLKEMPFSVIHLEGMRPQLS